MSRKSVRHSNVKPVVNVVFSVEERAKFVAFFEILVAVDKRVKKVKKKAKTKYGLDDSIADLVFISPCFKLLALILHHVLNRDTYDRYHCFIA